MTFVSFNIRNSLGINPRSPPLPLHSLIAESHVHRLFITISRKRLFCFLFFFFFNVPNDFYNWPERSLNREKKVN